MVNNYYLNVLKQNNIIQRGHFKLSSGLHSETFIQKFRIFEDPNLTLDLVLNLLDKEELRKIISEGIDIVLSSAVGGIILGYEIARVLGCKNVFAEKENGKLVLRRGFQLNKNDNVLIVDDVLTTGKSIQELVELNHKFDSNIVGKITLINRNNNINLDVPSLITCYMKTYTPDVCYMCQEGIELQDPGSRRLN